MPKSMQTLEEFDDHIISSRRATTEARFRPLAENVERLDSIYLLALDYLEERLSEAGFKAARSKLSLSRKVGDIRQIIELRPAGSNLSGVNAEISVHASLRSPPFKRWTQEFGTRYGRDILWTRQLGYLSGEHAFLTWQLVDPRKRKDELDDLLDTLRTRALSAFEAWATKELFATAVFRFSEVERIDWLVETALWAGHQEAATRLVKRHLKTNPADSDVFDREVARFKDDQEIDDPLPQPISGLAFLTVRHSLPIGIVP